ncbi:MAG: hypothetical protein JWL70_724, partial [Acidimicrobiia bacterium]|nr:hypothetical protein [Acidimicrobiia bacterium]
MSAVKSPWHAGEVTVQQRVGERDMADRLAPMIEADLPPVAQEFLRQQSFVVITGAGRDGRVWTGALAGPPGFLEPVTAHSVHIKAAVSSGDPLAPVLAGPALVGLLAIEPSTRRRMRLNGRWSPVADGFMIELDQVVSNCPKYISRRMPNRAGASPPPALQAPVTSRSLNKEQADWLSGADTFFIGTADGDGNADSSHRGGLPGFVEVLSANRFRFPDYSGNSMYMTL